MLKIQHPLKFSLEQASVEMITQLNRSGRRSDPFYLMLAHIYQGSTAAAKKYSEELRDFEFPASFEELEPQKLWQEWLVKDKGPLGSALKAWFSEKDKVVKMKRKKST